MKKIGILLVLLFVFQRGYTQPGPEELINHPWVDSVFQSLTVKERIAQLVWVNVQADDNERWQEHVDTLIRKYNLGAVIFFVGDPVRQVELTNHYQATAKTPLLVVMDAEWGPAMRLPGVTAFPYNMMMGAADPKLVKDAACRMACQLRRLGVHMNLGPSVDINTEPLNPIIGMRSFGASGNIVAERGIAYVRGMQEAGILTVAKHFPGHGDTRSDSHLTLPVIPWPAERLRSVELYPFRQLAEAGVGGIMTAHLHVPALDSARGIPAGFSSAIVGGILRDQWHYNGLIMTDAMNMAGANSFSGPGEAEVLALKAGNDVVEYPKDAEVTIRAIQDALEKGVLTQAEIDLKCRRVLAAKLWAGLDRYHPVRTEQLMTDLNTPAVELTKRKLIESSLTLLENREQLLPLKDLEKLKTACLTVGKDSVTPFAKMIARYMPVEMICLPEDFSADDLEKLKDQLSDFNLVIAGLHLYESKTRRSLQVGELQEAPPARPYGLTDPVEQLLRYLADGKKAVEVLFGSPYVLTELKDFRKPAGLIMAYQNDSLVQELAAQLIFGGIGASGRLPVSLSQYYAAGDGLTIEGSVRLKYTIPEEVGIRTDRLNAKIDSIVAAALQEKAMPGCQVLVAKDGKVIFHKAYGYHTFDRSAPVQEDDLYDLASVTKVSGGLPGILKLYDEGKIGLDKPVADYFPEWKSRLFHRSDKSDVTVRELYTHQSGLVPFISLWKQTLDEDGTASRKWYRPVPDQKYTLGVAPNLYLHRRFQKVADREIRKTPLKTRGTYVYSDLPLVITPRIVERVSGTDFQQYLEQEFYRPLGIRELTYNPLRRFPANRIAPTEDDRYYRHQLIQGTVHDESAAVLGGVSGNAGLFASANDLAKLMQLYLQMGSYGGRQYFRASAMQEFTRVQFPENHNRRGLIWDKPSLDLPSESPEKAYPCPGASPESFGHSGFTGTWVWMDPACGLTYVFLSNRVYPTRENTKLSTMNVRTDILQTVYDEIRQIGKIPVSDPDPVDRAVHSPAIRTGAEQTEIYLPWLKDKRVAIVGNRTSVIGKVSLVDSLLALGVQVKKVFGPEHGFRGDASAGIPIADQVDPVTGIPVVSLYGRKSKPSKEDLADVDLVIFDIQDVGARFYTYINLMGKVMEACAENGRELIILDRPNPNGFSVDGPVLDMKLKSGIGAWPIPITHGMTVGELARMYNGEGWLANKVTCKIRIVPVKHYTHAMTYTLPVFPSPNLNSQQAILLYPSTCLFEGTILSEGRGTYHAFSMIGAPLLKGKYDFSFTPVSIPGMAETPLHRDQECYGLDLRRYDLSEYIRTGKLNLKWLLELYRAYPDKERFFDMKQSRQIGDFDKLAGVYDLKQQIIGGKSEEEIRASWEPALSRFKEMRKKYLLYE